MALRQLAEVAQSLINMFYVYIIYNETAKKFYIGQTENVEQRLRLHNQKVFKGYTSRFEGVWKVVYSEPYQTRSEALKREKQLKSYRGREFIRKSIIVG